MNFGVKMLRQVLRTGGMRYSQKTFPADLEKAKYECALRPLSEYFTVGFSKNSILPDDILKKKYYIAGYHENNPAIGVLDAPQASALWIDDNSGLGGIVMVTLDAVGMLNKDIRTIRARLHDFAVRTGCRSINVMCTHDHAGIDTMGIWGPLPLTGRDPDYMEFVFAQVKKSVEEAYAARKKGKLYKGTVEVEDMQEDIRTPVVYSKTLTRLRFAPNDGSKETWFINFASHSESLQGCNSRVSADFPAYMRERILQESGAETFYCVGCIGGMISMEIADEKAIRDAGGDFAESTRNIGRKLAGYALSIKEETELKPKIGIMRQEVYFEADNTILMLAAKAGIMKTDHYHIPSSPLRHGLKSEISYFEIDTLKILLLPGELFPELAYGGYLEADECATGLSPDVNPTPLAEIIGGDVIFIGLANDEVGYILPPNDFLLNENVPYFDRAEDSHGRRHYEETNSLGPLTAETIANTVSEMMATVEKSKAL